MSSENVTTGVVFFVREPVSKGPCRKEKVRSFYLNLLSTPIEGNVFWHRPVFKRDVRTDEPPCGSGECRGSESLSLCTRV